MRIDISYNYILYSDLKLVMDALAFFRYFDLKKKYISIVIISELNETLIIFLFAK